MDTITDKFILRISDLKSDLDELIADLEELDGDIIRDLLEHLYDAEYSLEEAKNFVI